jgi:hypothetical protein
VKNNDVYHPKAQATALLRFANIVRARRKLGHDEAGNPRIEGKHGCVYVKPRTTVEGKDPVFQLYVFGGVQKTRHIISALSLPAASVRKGRSSVIVDIALGDITAERGAVILGKLGLSKRREPNLGSFGLKDQFPGQNTGVEGVPEGFQGSKIPGEPDPLICRDQTTPPLPLPEFDPADRDPVWDNYLSQIRDQDLIKDRYLLEEDGDDEPEGRR